MAPFRKARRVYAIHRVRHEQGSRRSLVLGGQTSPSRSQKFAKQRIALLVAAVVDGVDNAHHELGGPSGVQSIRFHRQASLFA